MPRIEREKLDAYVKEDPYVVNGLVRFLKAHFLDGETKVISLGVDTGMFLGPGLIIATRFPARFPPAIQLGRL